MKKIIDYLQSVSHSIDVLLALDALSSQAQDGAIGWNAVKEWCRKQGIILGDSAFRMRRGELIDLGLATKVPMDKLKNRVQLTKKGKQVATIVKTCIKELAGYDK